VFRVYRKRNEMVEPTARERRHADTKQAILRAARALILEKGPDKLALREIARRVGHSPAGLYEYFGSREEIVAAGAAEAFEQLGAELRRVPASHPVARRLIEIGLAYVRFARHNPEHFMLLFTQLPSGRASLQEPARPDSPYQIVLRAVQDGVDVGVFAVRPGYGVEEIAYGLWALAHGMAMLQQTHLRQFQADYNAADRRTLEVFVQGLIRA
jgi:AcrR family transcriptional regulator